jgi:mannonate dehydratase
MILSFRWYGPSDSVTLPEIRQIPGVAGIVTSLHEVPVGEAWPEEEVRALVATIEANGLRVSVIESIPVHEAIKVGRPERDRFIDAFCSSVAAVGAAGVPVVCYNFMPVFDWVRTDLAHVLPDGSTTLTFRHEDTPAIDLSLGIHGLPGWAAAYTPERLTELRAAYAAVDRERLWDHLAYFLERVVPVAESAGVRLAIHPDDPPWDVFGLPRIITDGVALERVVHLVDSPANGVTFCTGSLAPLPENDLPRIARRLGERIHFVHCRNVRRTGARSFEEVAHPSEYGDVDMYAVLRALHESGFEGPLRPDHGRMIWGEDGRPGYGLFDRALGATYLKGLWEALTRAAL